MGWRDEAFLEKLKSPVLVVGAGGIGCELLKDLVLSGFSNIEVIDLDTIDVSNLNRQFLFRREHVGQPKAKVAAEAVRKLAPNLKIVDHCASIFDESYGFDFFQKFALVFGALDNRAARAHINRLCLAARVPLIDGGSAGYRGQVSVIIRDRTECYECVPKPTRKTYPGCTIRNTPSEMVHCVVWAKHLFSQLFGEIDAENEVSPDVSDRDAFDGQDEAMSNGNENGKTDGEGEDGAGVVSVREWATVNSYNPEVLFRKFFHDDINYLLEMTNLWKERRKPVPLDWDDLLNQNPGSSSRDSDGAVWTPLQCREHFESALKVLKERAKEGTILNWDKDDDASMNFVGACSNLRAFIFNIPLKTLFELKSIAGNIIPAIATANAIVAGMAVVEAMKIISGRDSMLRNIFIQPSPVGRFWRKLLSDEIPVQPNPKCYACSKRREVIVKMNTAKTSMRALEKKLLKGLLAMKDPDVIVAGTPNLILSSEDGLAEEMAGKMVESVGVVNSTILECDDFQQKFELRVRVVHSDEMEADQFVILTDSEETNNGLFYFFTILNNSAHLLL
ncbi:unnamed protein product [Enterobius vermicularis]|uniref:SUMO-activating enzyme subunit n=1 Tax=Enterobius vermicularis TaxID=51028 RepID=A0A0N4VK88_ENTVE|nr:unnamed protein product [Enterobius vermicularis]